MTNAQEMINQLENHIPLNSKMKNILLCVFVSISDTIKKCDAHD